MRCQNAGRLSAGENDNPNSIVLRRTNSTLMPSLSYVPTPPAATTIYSHVGTSEGRVSHECQIHGVQFPLRQHYKEYGNLHGGGRKVNLYGTCDTKINYINRSME